jgi:hypothetical protein
MKFHRMRREYGADIERAVRRCPDDRPDDARRQVTRRDDRSPDATGIGVYRLRKSAKGRDMPTLPFSK